MEEQTFPSPTTADIHFQKWAKKGSFVCKMQEITGAYKIMFIVFDTWNEACFCRESGLQGIIIKIKIHSSCEIEYFVETHLCKLCVILRSRVLRVVCPH